MTNQVIIRRLHLDNGKNALLLLGLITLIFALLMPDRHQILANYGKLLSHQTYLVHDFFEIAGLSATFLNLALHFLITYILNIRNNLNQLTGFQIAAVGVFTGHSLFGTHLINVFPIILGIVLYSHWTQQSFKFYTSQSLFATATAPLVSFIMFYDGLSLGSFFLAIIVGLTLGFITPPLAEEFLKFHQGYTLYNIGFTTGIIGFISYTCLNYLKIKTPRVLILSETAHPYLIFYISGLCLLLIAFSFIGSKFGNLKQKFVKLNRRIGRLPDDFVLKYGRPTVLFNMGIMGLVYLFIILLLGMPINGPIAGGILSIMGFAAFGKHLRNTLPISLGVLLAALVAGQKLASLSVILPILFGTALAPIAGYYGIFVGMLAGFLQYSAVQIIFSIHSGLSLYNNGFTSGFIAAFIVPIANTIKDRGLTN